MRLTWEILTVLYRAAGIYPLAWTGRLFGLIAERWCLFWFSVGMLFPRSPTGTSRLYRCETCNRLCHTNATPGSYTAERGGDGVARLVGRCRKCEDKRA